MAAPLFSLADYVAAFQALLPTGRVWPRESSTQQDAITALMPTYVRSGERAVYLLTDSFPATANELLPEWEASLGLPDPCLGPEPTIEQRRAFVVAKLTSAGGQSIPFFISYAALIGYPITITQFVPFRAGRGHAGDAAQDDPWAFHWLVNAPPTTIIQFRAGASVAGEALQTVTGNAELECEINRLAPAQTTVSFSYGTGSP